MGDMAGSRAGGREHPLGLCSTGGSCPSLLPQTVLAPDQRLPPCSQPQRTGQDRVTQELRPLLTPGWLGGMHKAGAETHEDIHHPLAWGSWGCLGWVAHLPTFRVARGTPLLLAAHTSVPGSSAGCGSPRNRPSPAAEPWPQEQYFQESPT